jgi:hypothetical protein
MPLHFLHFDTSLRTDIKDDPFNCTLTLASPIRNIKKIYLKSCEIPVGFFNIRQPYTFSFYMTFPLSAYTLKQVPVSETNDGNGGIIFGGINGGGLYVEPEDPNNRPEFVYVPVVNPATSGKNYYYNWSEETVNNYIATINAPSVSELQNGGNRSFISINLVPGNYTIDTIISTINTAINTVYQKLATQLALKTEYAVSPTLTKVTISDTGAFPVGFVKLNYKAGVTVDTINTNYLTETILGFRSFQSDSTVGYIQSTCLWGIYNDLAIHLYFPNIPHNNTHFGGQLMSFKIPMVSGYQAIQFSADNQNFSQFIEVSDSHFILSNLKLIIFDTKGVPLTNQYNWNFTLGFET